MVEINRPDNQVEIGRSGVDSQAITEEAIVADSGFSSGEDGFSSGEDGFSSGEDGFSSGEEQSATVEGFAGSDSVSPESNDALSGAMHPDWQSAKTQKSRQIALVIALSATGLIAAVMFFGWFVSSWGQREVQQASSVGPQAADAVESSSGDPDTNQPANSSDTADQEDKGFSPTDSGVERGQPTSTIPDQADGNEPSASGSADELSAGTQLSDVPNTPDGAMAKAGGATATADGVANSGTGQPIPGDLLPPAVIEPQSNPDILAANDQTDGVDSITGENTEDAATVTGMQELPPELAQYTQFLLDDGAQTKPTLQAPPTMEEVKLEAAAVEEDEDLRIQIVPKELDLRADLAIRLALASDGYPATDLMLLVSQVTGVPIQMDWPSFDLAGADIQQQVPTTKDWRSAKDLLEEAAVVLNAEIREQETLLLITLGDNAFDQAVTRLQSLDDFGAGSATAREFLEGFIGGDNGDVDPREAGQLICFATEALRRMRGIPPRMEEVRFGRWAREVNDSQAEWAVLPGGDFGPQLDAPMSVAGLLRRTAKRNQATCVFNWLDAVRRGAPPEHLLMPHKEEDAGLTLGNTLSPLGLQVRQVDSKHWWVGTEATYDRLPIFVWTPPLGEARDGFVERMNKVVAGASPIQYRLAIDESSDRALMLLPRFIVRQLPTIIPAIAAKQDGVGN